MKQEKHCAMKTLGSQILAVKVLRLHVLSFSPRTCKSRRNMNLRASLAAIGPIIR